MRDLVIPALNLALVSFVSLMLTARSFAAKNGYEINADAEFGRWVLRTLCLDYLRGLLSVEPIPGPRLMIQWGKSQLVSIVAALLIGIVVVFFTQPLQFIPVSALGIVLMYASWSLIDLRGLWNLRRRNKQAFRLAFFTFGCVLIIGVIQGIGLAVLLGLLQFLRTVFRPSEHLLGTDENGMIHSLGNTTDIKMVPGVLMYRFNSPLTYFNVAYFKRRVLNLVDGAALQPKWVVIDAVACFTYSDISVLATINELKRDLKGRQITLILAGRKTELTRWFKDSRPTMNDDDMILAPDLYLALRFIQSKESASESGGEVSLACPPTASKPHPLAIQRLFRNRDNQPGSPVRERQLRKPAQRGIKRMTRVVDKHRQEAGAPRQQVPRQKLVALRIAAILNQPRRQQQQGTEMIFRFILLHLKRDAVLTHPLAQREGRVAKQHGFAVQPDGTPRRSGQGIRANKQPLPGVRQRLIGRRGKGIGNGLQRFRRQGPVLNPFASGEGLHQRRGLLAVRSEIKQRAQHPGAERERFTM
jgi:hypothetical protein